MLEDFYKDYKQADYNRRRRKSKWVARIIILVLLIGVVAACVRAYRIIF